MTPRIPLLRRSLHRRPWFVLAAVVIFFVLAEGAARLGLHLYLHHTYGSRLWEFREADLVPTQDTGWAWNEPMLFRGGVNVEEGPHPGLFRIITVGDSCVWGAMVPPPATFSAKLGRLLRDRFGRGRVEVLNAGVVGYGTRQVITHLRETLAPYRPDLVIYYGTGSNAEARLQGARHSRLPGLEPLSPYLLRSKLFLVTAHAVRRLTARRKPDTWLPQNDDLAELESLCRTLGADLVLVEYLLVERGGLTSDIAGAGLQFNVPVVRTLDAFREQGRPLDELMYDHVHPTPAGHTLIASRLFTEITRRDLVR
ncbi:MAG: SGNH/GDSL hydrolase family protein [Candidatus Lernaella stagnicola]|nr:SGNH/GDSL hydrolase family protein [Candidatus Lernaella stagnicola]